MDRITEDKNVSLAKLEPLSKRLSEYLIELSPDSSTTGVLESLTDALYDIYIGKADSSSFIMGAYTVSLTYDTANELLTVNAAPAE